MLNSFTPFSFFFLTFYLFIISFLFSVSNFILFWVLIEFSILLFIGISFTLFFNSLSSLILYFLVQTLSSFNILIFFLFPHPILFFISILLKLSIFPFHFWFLSVCYSFPNFLLFLVSSIHKLPIFLILNIFPLVNFSFIFWLSTFMSILVRGRLMLVSSDIRLVLVTSSVGNNSWFLLASMSNFNTFLLYFLVYCFFLFSTFYFLSYFSKPSNFSVRFRNLDYFTILLVSLRGLPPFPLFFVKIFVLISLFLTFDLAPSFFLFILFSSLMLIGYVQSASKFIVHAVSSQSLSVSK